MDNSGVAGLCTLHANSARDAIIKICTLPLLAGPNITSDFTIKTVAACLDLVVHCVRDASGNRYVNEILAVRNRVEGGAIETSTLFERKAGELVPASGADWSHEKFDLAGLNVAERLGQES